MIRLGIGFPGIEGPLPVANALGLVSAPPNSMEVLWGKQIGPRTGVEMVGEAPATSYPPSWTCSTNMGIFGPLPDFAVTGLVP